MQTKPLTIVAALLAVALAGCTDAQPLADYVASEQDTPAMFMLASTSDESAVGFFQQTGMEENPGEMSPEQFGGNNTGAQDAYGSLLVHEQNDTRLIFWGAVRFADASASQEFTDSISANQACFQFAGVLLDQDVVVMVQSSADNETADAAASIASDLESSRGMERIC